MKVHYILGGLAAVFLLLGCARLLRDGGHMGPAVKAWLLVGGIFAFVTAWLVLRR